MLDCLAIGEVKLAMLIEDNDVIYVRSDTVLDKR